MPFCVDGDFCGAESGLPSISLASLWLRLFDPVTWHAEGRNNKYFQVVSVSEEVFSKNPDVRLRLWGSLTHHSTAWPPSYYTDFLLTA